MMIFEREAAGSREEDLFLEAGKYSNFCFFIFPQREKGLPFGRWII